MNTRNKNFKILILLFSFTLIIRLAGEYRYGDTRHIYSDISRIQSIVWKPTRSIYDSVAEYKEYLIGQTAIGDILDYAQKQMKKLGE